MRAKHRHRLLFVDDEPMVLHAIKRILKAHEDQWQATFAGSGAEGLQALSTGQVDVLITDMVMPGIDGATLLQAARANHPDTIRIVLSGYSEFEHTMRSVPFAHQRLLKPCTRPELVAVIERACALRELVNDPAVRSSISKVGSLPSSAAVFAQLSQVLDSPQASFASVAQVISPDMAMVAKLLQLANSAMIAAGRRITDPVDAVRTVGLDAIRQYLVSPFLEVFSVFSPQAPGDDARFEELRHHALLTANLARALSPKPEEGSIAFLAGLLHDIGRLVLLARMPDVLADLEARAKANDCSLEELEVRHLGVSHADIGAYLLGLWGLPAELCEAIASHHSHDQRETPTPLTRLVRFANWLATEHTVRTLRGVKATDVFVTDLDPEWAKDFAVKHQLQKLLTLAQKTDQALQHEIGQPAKKRALPAKTH